MKTKEEIEQIGSKIMETQFSYKKMKPYYDRGFLLGYIEALESGKNVNENVNLKKSTKILDLHNQWRMGADIPMQDVAKLGLAIDTILKHLKNNLKTACCTYKGQCKWIYSDDLKCFAVHDCKHKQTENNL